MVSILKIIAGSGSSGKFLADYVGLEADTKPDNCMNGSTYYAMDSATMYHYDEENETWYDEAGIGS